MTRNSKRAFTLVELIIVIAVIGVLAAILIPVFSNVVDKANIADKTSLARNLNSMIAADKEEVVDVSTMQEAMIIAHKQGYTDEQIFNTKTAGTIVFNTQTGNFAVATKVENGTATLAYADQGMTTAPAAALMAPVEATEIPGIADQQFGMYLIDTTESAYQITVNTAVSVETGSVVVKTINLDTTAEGTFTINGDCDLLNVNAPNAVVNHYGHADVANIVAVDTASYHEFGTVGTIKIALGHLVIEASAVITSGIKVLDVASVTVTLFTESAITAEGATESELMDMITAGANHAHWTAQVAETIGFAAGSGTENDPYIISTAKHLLNMDTYCKYSWTWAGYEDWYSEHHYYTYYKVADGITEIDLSTLPDCPDFCGVFDGNGVKFTGVTNHGVFAKIGSKAAPVSIVKNLSFEARMIGGSHRGALCSGYCYGDCLIENVDAYGYLESSNAASYISYGNAAQGAWNCTFRNCTSHMKLVSTSANTGGFIAHQYCGTGSVLTFENSEFVGSMYTVSTGAKFKYFTAMDYAVASIVVKTDKNLPITGSYGSTGEHTFDTTTNVQYLADGRTGRIQGVTLTAPSKYDVFTATAPTGAVKAKASLIVGPNKLNYDGKGHEGGNYTGTAMSEYLTPVNGVFTTEMIKYFDITINGDATPRTGVSDDGHTYNLVNEGYSHTCGSAWVDFYIYDGNGELIQVAKYNFVADQDYTPVH